MLHLVLFLLKIIGILIGVILGLLLILILVVLLVPIHYRIWADNREDLQGRVKVTWLLRIISLQVAYVNEKLSIKLKIFGRIFFDNNTPRKAGKGKGPKLKKNSKKKKVQDKNRKVSKQASKSKTEIETKSELIKDVSQRENMGDISSKDQNTRNVENQSLQQNPSPSLVSEIEIREQNIKTEIPENQSKQLSLETENVIHLRAGFDEETDINSEKDPKFLHRIKEFFQKIKNIFSKMKDFFQKIKMGFEKVKNLFHNLGESISNITEKWDKIKNFYKSNKLGIKQSFYAIKKVIKHVMPRKIKGQVEFGTGDPASTGQVLGAAACFYGIYGKYVQIIPNFNEVIIEGNIYIYGRIRLVTLLIIGVKLILNKNFKELIKNFRALKEDL